MKHGPRASATYQPWPRWWRIVLVAISTLILCSCRAARQASIPSSCPPATSPALPQQAFTGIPGGYPGLMTAPTTVAPGPTANGTAQASLPVGPWAPPGLSTRPWPQDEYLCDGGDAVPTATVREDWEIRGLNVEDTIGHFDTVDGRRIVAPSNRVCIYSPRFGAVRQVVSLKQNEQRSPWAGVHQPVKLVSHDDLQIAATGKQHFQAEAEVGRKLPTIYRSKQGDGAMSTVNGPIAFQDAYLPREVPSVVRQGIFEESETAWLAHGVTAAARWSHTAGVQVIIDRTRAAAEVSDQQLEAVYTIRRPPANPKLRVIKLASTEFAEPGETVDFTILFDNVGDQVIGNVTLIDNLTTRLEYVPDTAQCSVPAQFFKQPNEGESLSLRWEITEPLQPGQRGEIHFRCRVR